RVGDRDPLDALASLRIADLYLCCACARGDRAALAALERGYFGDVDGALASFRGKGIAPEEIKQQLRERLLTARDGGRPRILDYGGRGDLGRWLRAVAVRAAIDAVRQSGREVLTGDDALVDRALPSGDA